MRSLSKVEEGECALCLQLQDTVVHVFARCSITRQIWTILQEVFNNITETSFPLDNLTPLNFFLPIQFKNFTESIALIITVTNYCIWQARKKQLNSAGLKLEIVKPSNVLEMILNHIKIREKRDSSLTDTTNHEVIKNIRTKVGRKLHNLFTNYTTCLQTTPPVQVEYHLFSETVLSASRVFCFFFCV